MEFFVGGYFLVQGVQSADWMNKNLLPAKFWTVCTCICKVYPDTWAFSWTSQAPDRAKEQQELLQLDDEAFKSLQTWVDELFNHDEVGWPHVFMDIELAKQFYLRYLKHLPDLKLLSIALPEAYWTEFIEENTPEPGMGAGGVYQKLLQKQILKTNGLIRGFEILGDEWGGQFHSFVCNSLEEEYVGKLKIALNQYGLIDRYEDAVKASDYTSLDEVGSEPALWQPWLISEYPLPA